ncbi:type VII secretion protein EccB [Kitasatospora sp. NBC_00315]|uniref:type VII secretion protein EccB n=1 Tax=Kitasatospora sp. NBC_00315 TaxID=2975963 RepID=UPI00324DE3C8
MASRRDELNAYTFARKRTVGAFLLPGGGGSDEDAPRPVKAVLPSIVVGTLVVAGFGLWGAFKPSAPVGWDNGKNIIQGKTSTTRYVILPDQGTGTPRLHQVLNMASARLLLSVDSKVVVVADQVLDAYPNHGPTVGIQYAPDKLPSKDVAGQPMLWSVCDSPGSDAKQETVNQTVFVAGGADAKKLADKDEVLDVDQAVFVQQIDDSRIGGQEPVGTQSRLQYFLVDALGRSHAIGTTQTSDEEKKALVTALFGATASPQRVKPEWIKTLDAGMAITFPQIPKVNPSAKSANSSVQLQNPADRKIGRLVKFGEKNYVVGADQLYPITELQSSLLKNDPALQGLYDQDSDKHPKVDELTPADQAKYGQGTLKENKLGLSPDWPAKSGHQMNTWDASKDAKKVVCSTFTGMDADGKPKRSVWVGTQTPTTYSSGSSSAHVTAGYGLFYRAVDAGSGGSGSDFLITETGLRYAVQANSDAVGAAKSTSPAPTASAQADGQQTQQAAQDEGGTQARLGYKDIQPLPVPKEWSDLVPDGPGLNTKTALQQQNS